MTCRGGAALVRVLHAELERIANHLDVALRLADAAGLAVATARFGWHKERVLRLVGRLCGSRFGRGVVVPGGVAAPAAADRRGELLAESDRLERAVPADLGDCCWAPRRSLTGCAAPARSTRAGPASTARSARSDGPAARR